MEPRSRLLPISALALATCVRTAPQPMPAYWASSDSSQYSPVARLRVRPIREGATLRLVVDSGIVTIPGVSVPGAPPLMSRLFLTAIAAAPDSGTLGVTDPGTAERPAERRAWRPVITSDSVLLVDELRYGERRSVPRVTLTLRDVPPPSSTPMWVIFRISGNAVELAAPLVEGGQPRRRDHPDGVRVYVCGDHDLTGRRDSARLAALRRAYGLAC